MAETFSDSVTIQGTAPTLIFDDTSGTVDFQIDVDASILTLRNGDLNARVTVPSTGDVTLGSASTVDMGLQLTTDSRSARVDLLHSSGDLVVASDAGDVAIQAGGAETARFDAAGGLTLKEKASPPTSAADQGDYWVKNTTPASPAFQADDGTDRYLVQGPSAFAAVADNAIARFDGTTGGLVQNSATTTIDDSGNLDVGNSGSVRFGASTRRIGATDAGTAVSLWSGGNIYLDASGSNDVEIRSSGTTYAEFDGGGKRAAIDADSSPDVTQAKALAVRATVDGSATSDYVAMFANKHTTPATSARVFKVAIGRDNNSADYFFRCFGGNTGGSGGTLRWYVRGDGVTPGTFTGQHYVVYEAEAGMRLAEEAEPGMIVETTGALWADVGVNRALPVVRLSTEAGSPRVYGVIAADWSADLDLGLWSHFTGAFHPDSQADPGALDADEPATHPYDASSRHFKCRVNSLGAGKVWVTDENGPVNDGDYICTSGTPGYGMAQGDDTLRSRTVAKCVQQIDWAKAERLAGGTGRRALVACTYHCG